MAEDFRLSEYVKSPGPFLATVVNHLDQTFMGTLEVQVLRVLPNSPEQRSGTVPVKYCSPFMGSTSIKFEGNTSSNFDDVQKSYGMWMIPPDIGATVMVIFIDGNINQGYWFGCVPDKYQNFMIPGLAASQFSAITPEQERYYGTKYLPVAEYHKKSRKGEIPTPDTFTKPVHPFADRLLQQGLLLDTVRGVTNSSARREAPSAVFGISTPGPIDLNSPAKQIGFDTKIQTPVSRLGGTTFVMDDGDKDGLNEHVRIRTRTGHQILLHNSSDLIYIGNAKGTAWIELTANGKIDIFAEDSVSIHTGGDFNFRAERDVNIEAVRDVNISSGGDTNLNSFAALYAKVGTEGRIEIGSNFNLSAGAEFRVSSVGDLSLLTTAEMKQQANGQFNIGAVDNVLVVGRQVLINTESATSPTSAESPTPLSTFTLPNRRVDAGWSDGKFYKASSLTSIMKRVPTHEPWDHHENINPTQFSFENTDRTKS